eukprot:gene9579-23100_t
MARAAALLLASSAAAQHHDPFAGSGCDCARFCGGECSIFPEPAPVNVTMYRMTPLNVDTATDKNTGDDLGDTSYVMSRRTSAYECAHSKDPSN